MPIHEDYDSNYLPDLDEMESPKSINGTKKHMIISKKGSDLNP